MKHRPFERSVCSGFSCALLREWPVGTDLSQAHRCLVWDGGLPPACLWASQFCNWSWARPEHSGKLLCLASVWAHQWQSIPSPAFRQCSFHFGLFHLAPWRAMGDVRVPTFCAVTNNQQSETLVYRGSLLVSLRGLASWNSSDHAKALCPFGGKTLQKVIHERCEEKKILCVILALI